MSDTKDTLPPVRCPQPDCGALMDLTPSGYVACAANMSHTPLLLCSKAQRAAWRAEKRKVQLEVELAILPVALRLVYREATPGTPGRYLYTIGVQPGFWCQGSGPEALEAAYGDKKRSFVRAPDNIEDEFRAVFSGPLAQPTPEAPADAAPTA